MGRFLLRWVVLAVAVIAASAICQALNLGFQAKAGNAGEVVILMLGVAVLAILNATLGKILKLITLPLSCLTLGLFAFVINALIFWMAASLELGFRITQEGWAGFLAAAVASALVSLINGALQLLIPPKDDEK